MLRTQEIGAKDFTRMIVGLGNPGDRYAQTRHNVGFMVLETLAREEGGRWSNELSCRVCGIQVAGRQVLLVEPMTYMNHSGRAIETLLMALERKPQDLMLVVDDLNLPFGKIRVRERGSAGGHHGLESILTVLNSDEIVRIRMGIGEEQMPEDKASFVLSDFAQEKQAELDDMILRAGNAIKTILRDGVSKTMAIFNA